MKFQKNHKINIGRIVSEETKKKISEAQKGKPRLYAIGNKSRTGMKNSKEMKEKSRYSHKGEKAYNYKGNEVSYSGLHHWLKRWFGKPDLCEFCGIKNKKYTYANKSGKYLRDRNDWLKLCYSCHKLFDLKRKNYGRNS